MFAAFLTSALLELRQQERQASTPECSDPTKAPLSPLSVAAAALLKKWMQEQQFQAKA